MLDAWRSYAPFRESFRPPFSKGSAVEGAEPSSPSAEGEIISNGVFFLIAFSFAPIWSKEKAAKGSDAINDRDRPRRDEADFLAFYVKKEIPPTVPLIKIKKSLYIAKKMCYNESAKPISYYVFPLFFTRDNYVRL